MQNHEKRNKLALNLTFEDLLDILLLIFPRGWAHSYRNMSNQTTCWMLQIATKIKCRHDVDSVVMPSYLNSIYRVTIYILLDLLLNLCLAPTVHEVPGSIPVRAWTTSKIVIYWVSKDNRNSHKGNIFILLSWA